MTTPGGFVPTHLVPPSGLATWPEPDPAKPEGTPLAAGVEVQVVERRGEWARVLCSTGFAAWVDARPLVGFAAAAAPAASASALPRRLQKIAELDFSFSRPLVAAAIVAVAGPFAWIRSAGLTANGFDVPVIFLFDFKTTSRGGLSVGLVLLVAGVAGGVGVVVRERDILRRVSGFAAAAIAVAYVVSLQRVVSAAGAGGSNLLETLGPGALVAFAAGLVMALTKPPAG